MTRCNFLSLITCLAALFGTPAMADNSDALIHSGIINAPVADVWDAFTNKEGLESWMVPHAEMDLRIGGLMRSTYNADGVIGDDSTIENTILSFQPQGMLSFRNTRAPKNFPFKAAIEKTWTVLLFEPMAPDRTKLTITMLGYGDDEESIAMREKFNAGNQWTLEKLQAKFAGNDTAQADDGPRAIHDRILKLLGALVGGEWIVENTRPNGSIFRARSVYEFGPDHQSLIARGWLGGDEGMLFHGATQIWREPAGADGAQESIRFQSIDENGSIARGNIEMHGDDALLWHWDSTALDGKVTRYKVRMVFDAADAYHFTVSRLDENDLEQALVDVRFRRVEKAPEAFHRVQAARPGP